VDKEEEEEEDWEPPVYSPHAPISMDPGRWEALTRKQMYDIKHTEKLTQKQIDLIDEKINYNNLYEQGTYYHKLPALRRPIAAETKILGDIKLGKRRYV
jgi:hypothetical protein